MRVALVHYWLVNDRGGEKVLKAFHELFPDATIFTHVVDFKKMPAALVDARIETTFISKIPFAKSKYQLYLPFMPTALEALDLSEYDLVISSESGPAKGVLPAPGATHICYVHSPMRYIWNMYAEYVRRANPAVRTLFPWIANYLRLYDVTSAARVDEFVANSHNVARRVHRYWGRAARVLHPPVAVEDFDFSPAHEDFYLYVGELVDYKRADVIVDAFTETGLPLVVIGSGPDEKRIKRGAGTNVKFLGRTDFATLKSHYERCKAFVFAAEEDFGIVPVEAMACGKPVLAFGRGGALETVIEGRTGLFFKEQTAAAVARTVSAFEDGAGRFDPHVIRAHAESFATPVFKAKFMKLVEQMVDPLPAARRAAE